MRRQLSVRSQIRAWSVYAALGYTGVTVAVMGLTVGELAARMHLAGPLQLHGMFLGRLFGALAGTILGGWLLDTTSLKLLMCCFITLSALSIIAVPHAADIGLVALLADWGIVGGAGAALVCCASTTACWAFPGKEVGPILSGMLATYGVTSALLPAVFWILGRGHLDIEYVVVAAFSVPAIILILASDPPVKSAVAVDDDCSKLANIAGQKLWYRQWLLACAASFAQMLLQGTSASMLAWLKTFGEQEVELGGDAALLVTVLQSCVTLGSLAATLYQGHFNLLDLACTQLAVVALGIAFWLLRTNSPGASVVAIIVYGFVGGPTLGYCSSLYNQYAQPSGAQMALINIGSNCGTGLVPYIAGLLMERYGPSALLWLTLSTNGFVLLGFLMVRSIATYSKSAAAREDSLKISLVVDAR